MLTSRITGVMQKTVHPVQALVLLHICKCSTQQIVHCFHRKISSHLPRFPISSSFLIISSWNSLKTLLSEMLSFSIIRWLNFQRCQQLQLCLFTHLGEAPLGHVLFSKPRCSLTKAMQQNQLWPLRCWPPHRPLALCHLPAPNRRLCYTLRTCALCSVCAASRKMAPCPVPGAAACRDSAGTQRPCASPPASRAGAARFTRSIAHGCPQHQRLLALPGVDGPAHTGGF